MPKARGQHQRLLSVINSPLLYHFTAPKVRPAIKCFCIRKNIRTGGKAARMEPAETKCHAATHCPFNDDKPAVIGWVSLVVVSTVAQKKSFQMKVKISTDSAAIAGFINGRTLNQKIRNSDTPSTRAASINSNGRALMKLRMNSVQNPV